MDNDPETYTQKLITFLGLGPSYGEIMNSFLEENQKKLVGDSNMHAPYDLSASPSGLEQGWLRNPLTGGSTRLAVCNEPILLAGLGI